MNSEEPGASSISPTVKEHILTEVLLRKVDWAEFHWLGWRKEPMRTDGKQKNTVAKDTLELIIGRR